VILRSLALSFTFLLAACAGERELYRWGSYEDCVRETCRDPSGAQAVDRIRRLAADIERAKAEGLAVGPGWHAQLGYLCALTGKHESAALEFAAEREVYPESAVFVDGLLRRMPSEPDRAAYAAHVPRSILVLPPLAETVAADAPCAWLATITRPLAERGYYVFPVAIVDAMLKENGLRTPREMHQVPLGKLDELFGTDAVLYVGLESWGVQVTVAARLVDVKSGTELWRGTSTAVQSSDDDSEGGVAGTLVRAIAKPIVQPAVDPTLALARQANWVLIHSPQGLHVGPHHPDFDEDQGKHRK